MLHERLTNTLLLFALRRLVFVSFCLLCFFDWSVFLFFISVWFVLRGLFTATASDWEMAIYVFSSLFLVLFFIGWK